jgi:hypothetical protein
LGLGFGFWVLGFGFWVWVRVRVRVRVRVGFGLEKASDGLAAEGDLRLEMLLVLVCDVVSRPLLRQLVVDLDVLAPEGVGSAVDLGRPAVAEPLRARVGARVRLRVWVTCVAQSSLNQLRKCGG